MIYADSDTQGNITAYYSSDINTEIPSTAIVITEDQWQDSLSNPGKYIVQNRTFVINPNPPVTTATPEPKPLDQQNAENIANLTYQLMMNGAI